ncbi:MAG: ParB N-terminal domain-containing protein [Symploca sp. SIO2G7]|nr:ParB N-terminal domain-containing protein [Symploca sp. SIO2G7]
MARRKKTKIEAEEIAQEQHLMELYDSSEVGMIATTKSGRIGIVTDKLISEGGLPSLWVQEAGKTYPTLEPINLITKVEKKATAVILFAGGGGVEAGLIEAGIEPLLSVEYDPDKPELSEAMNDAHEANFPQCRVIRRTVQELAAEDFPGFPEGVDVVWASPPCKNYSAAKRNAVEQVDDVAAAKAVVVCIRKSKPKHLILENVPAYRNSESWKGLNAIIPSLGYSLRSTIVDMSNYGIPQARKRFIAWASRDDQFHLEMPEKLSALSWHEAITDLIPNLPDSELTKGQQTGVKKFLEGNEPEPLLIWASRPGRPIKSSSTANTILRSHFTDGKGGNRNRFADIWLPDGTTKQLTIECVRRLQSFPDWYEFPEEVGVAGSILGYSVPPKFVEQFLKPIGQINHTTKVATDWIEKASEEINEVQEQINAAALTQDSVPKNSKDYRLLQKHINEETDRRAELMGKHSAIASLNGYQLLPCPTVEGDSFRYEYQLEEEEEMILSFGYTADKLHQKTVTRRDWKERYAQQFIKSFREGKLVDAYDKSPRNGGKKVAALRLTAEPYQEKLEDMPESEVTLEGYPELSKQEFIDKFFGDFDTAQPLWVVRFAVVPFSPGDRVVQDLNKPEWGLKNRNTSLIKRGKLIDFRPISGTALHPFIEFEDGSEGFGIWDCVYKDEGEIEVCQPVESTSSQSKKAFDEVMEAMQGNGNHALSVQTSSKSDEHYTPDEVVEATITTLETIDLDPCSNSHDQPNIPASNHYTIEDDGLSQSWAIGEGRIYLNPPYSATAAWVDKLLEEYSAGGVKEAVVLVKSATDTKWYQQLDKFPKCLWNGRLKFKGNSSPAPFASSIFYLGENFEKFQEAFSKHGRVHGVPLIPLPQITKSKSQFSFLNSQSTHTPTALPIAQIRRDGGTQPREKLDLNHVATLKDAIADGAELEPVVVFYDGEDYWLADGFHRCKASEESGLEDIPVIIHQGTRRDAVLYSVGANAEHKAAKPRSRKDKRRAVMMLLNDPEWSEWSNYQIAQRCKVNEKTVRNIRNSITTEIRSEDKPKTRTYTTKHGTTATMQVGSIGKGSSETGNGENLELPDSGLENSKPPSANNGNGTLPKGNDHSNNGNNGNGDALKINRPANRWYGGKWRIGQWIASHFPEHKIYVEPFGGMYSVGLLKPSSEIEVYNDIHPEAVNFWQQLKDNSGELIRRIEALTFNETTVEWAKQPSADFLESATKFYIQCRISYAGGGTGWASGYSSKAFDKPENDDHSHLQAIANRIKDIQIYQLDALEIIERFDSPDTLFYCDPPYIQDTRNSHTPYEYEYSIEQHSELIELLGSIKGKAIISGYPSSKYASLLQGWHRKETTSRATSGKDTMECLWIKPTVEIVDYVIGFVSNIDQMSAEQLLEVRDRIEQRLQALQCPAIPKNGKSTQNTVLVGKN